MEQEFNKLDKSRDVVALTLGVLVVVAISIFAINAYQKKDKKNESN
jgi:hypothetical protein